MMSGPFLFSLFWVLSFPGQLLPPSAIQAKILTFLYFFICLLLAGIPNAFYFGQEGLHNILCIDLLGPSLEDLFDMCGRKFTIKTVVMVAKQMVRFFCFKSLFCVI